MTFDSMMLTRKDTEWGRRMDAAMKRGGFTDDDRHLVSEIWPISHESGSCGCCITELFEPELFDWVDDGRVDVDLRLHNAYDDFPHLVFRNKVQQASDLYDEILRIRNEEYE